MDYKDTHTSFDYIASVLHPTFSGLTPREELAKECMSALFLEDGQTPLEQFHPKAANLLELLAIRLMGQEWCQNWINSNTR